LLLESSAKNLVDMIIVVKCGDDARIQRLLKKGKHTKKQIEKITKSQMPTKEKLKFADFVIDNSGSLAETEEQVKKQLKNFK